MPLDLFPICSILESPGFGLAGWQSPGRGEGVIRNVKTNIQIWWATGFRVQELREPRPSRKKGAKKRFQLSSFRAENWRRTWETEKRDPKTRLQRLRLIFVDKG